MEDDKVLSEVVDFATSYGDEALKYFEHINWDYDAYASPSELHAELELARGQMTQNEQALSSGIFDVGFDEGACSTESGGFGGGISENCEGEGCGGGFASSSGFDSFGNFGSCGGAVLDSELGGGFGGFGGDTNWGFGDSVFDLSANAFDSSPSFGFDNDPFKI